MVDGPSVDRRTFLKGTGAASAGTLFGASAVQAGDALEHVIALSDTHLGSAYDHHDALVEFLSTTVHREKPDALLLIGDFIELWWRGLTSALFDATGVLTALEEVHESGTSVVPIVGNHDWRFRRVNDADPIVPAEPWQFAEELTFESGGRTFTAVHGHQVDPANMHSANNEIYCLSDDEQGHLAYQAIGEEDSQSDPRAVERVTLDPPPIGALIDDEFSVSENVVADGPAAVDPVALDAASDQQLNRLSAEGLKMQYDGFIVFGHTHVPGRGDGWVNCGTWTDHYTDRPDTYVEIRDGDVSLTRWLDGTPGR